MRIRNQIKNINFSIIKIKNWWGLKKVKINKENFQKIDKINIERKILIGKGLKIDQKFNKKMILDIKEA